MEHPQESSCPQCRYHIMLSEESDKILYCPNCQLPQVVVAGKYRLEEKLSEGGGGVLYLARHQRLKMEPIRVIKFLRTELISNSDAERRFSYEVEITSAISQRNDHIVRIYDDFGKIDKLGHYYVMEFLQGQSLAELLLKKEEISFKDIFHIFKQLCVAIREAHAVNVVHRDLKPDNIFLIKRKQDPLFVKVIDFGIAKDFASSTQHTKGVIGTPEYMAPEQCAARPLDHRADIYAMGVLLFEMIVGHSPFVGSTGEYQNDLMYLIFAQLSKEMPNIHELVPQRRITEKLENILQVCLKKDPKERYQSVDELLQAVEEAEAEYLNLPQKKQAIPTGSFTFSHAPQPIEKLTKNLTPSEHNQESLVNQKLQFSEVETPQRNKVPIANIQQSSQQTDFSIHQKEVQISNVFEPIQESVVLTREISNDVVLAHPRKIILLRLFLLLSIISFLVIVIYLMMKKKNNIQRKQIITQKIKKRTRKTLVRKVVVLSKKEKTTTKLSTIRTPKIKKRLIRRVKKRFVHRVKKRFVRRVKKRFVRRYHRKARRKVAFLRGVKVRKIPLKAGVLKLKRVLTKGCPKDSSDGKWIRINILPKQVRIHSPYRKIRYSSWYCILQKKGQRQRVRLRALHYQECMFIPSFHHRYINIRLKKISPYNLDENFDYCLKKNIKFR